MISAWKVLVTKARRPAACVKAGIVKYTVKYRQADPWGSMTSQNSLPHKLQADKRPSLGLEGWLSR